MKVAQVQSQNNFGKFLGWNINIKKIDCVTAQKLAAIKQCLDKRQSNNINILGDVFENPDMFPGKTMVRFYTTPLLKDIIEIQRMGRIDAKIDDYKRKSPMFFLNEVSPIEIARYINKQIGFIHYCTKDPNHNAKIIPSRKN